MGGRQTDGSALLTEQSSASHGLHDSLRHDVRLPGRLPSEADRTNQALGGDANRGCTIEPTRLVTSSTDDESPADSTGPSVTCWVDVAEGGYRLSAA